MSPPSASTRAEGGTPHRSVEDAPLGLPAPGRPRIACGPSTPPGQRPNGRTRLGMHGRGSARGAAWVHQRTLQRVPVRAAGSRSAGKAGGVQGRRGGCRTVRRSAGTSEWVPARPWARVHVRSREWTDASGCAGAQECAQARRGARASARAGAGMREWASAHGSARVAERKN